jgi:hypothetical protein
MVEQKKVTDAELLDWLWKDIANRSDANVVATYDDVHKLFAVGSRRYKELRQVVLDRLRSHFKDSSNRTRAELLAELQQERSERSKMHSAIDLFAEAYRQIADTLPAYRKNERQLPKTNRKKKDKQPASMMVNWSDWQLGEDVNPQHIAGLGAYNMDIAKQRLRRMRDEIIIIHDEWSQPRDLPELRINLLGDMIEGDRIFSGQEWFTDLDITRQCVEGVHIVASLIRDLGIYFPSIKIYCVPGNHGRLGGRKPREAVPPGLNAEVLFYRFVQHQISHLDGVTMCVTQCPWLGYKLYDRNYLLSHGHQTKMWNQIPWYGMTRDTMRLVAMTQVPWHYHMVGHFHQAAEFPVSALRVIANGSLVGPNLYSAETMHSAVPAVQKVFLVHPEHGIAWRLDLTFDEPQPLTVDEDGLYTPVDDGSSVKAVTAGEFGGW